MTTPRRNRVAHEAPPDLSKMSYHDLFRDPTAAIQPLEPEERRVLRLVNQRITALPTLDDVIDFLFERTSGIFPFDRIGLSFIEEDGRRVVSRYARATYEPLLLDRGFSDDLRGSSLEQVLESGAPRIINDLVAYLDQHPHSRSTKLIVQEGVRSNLTCPLIVEGRVVGFMFRSSRQANAYNQHHVALQLAIGDLLGQAVEKAWRIEQLTAANRAYMEMLGFVSHELKSPVASMVTDARLLVDGYLGPLEDRQKEKLERLIARGEYLLDLVREYLDLARVEGNELKLKLQSNVAFEDEVLEPSIEVIRPQIEARGMLVELDSTTSRLLVDCDPALMRIVMVNLLGNAVKYGYEGGHIDIRVGADRGRVRVTVRNDGPGFRRRDRARLFRKFSRLKDPAVTARRGTGLGLYNAWRIVQLHKGTIRADAKHGDWAEFSFEIPQPLRVDDFADSRHKDVP